MENIKTEKAFIASNKYIVRESNDAGTGVIVSYDEEIEKKESKRLANVKSLNIWFDILIPSDDFFLNLYKPLQEQNSFVKAALRDKNNLQTIFYSEALRLNRELEEHLKDVPSDERFNVFEEKFSKFYKEKEKELFEIKSGRELLFFITRHTKSRNQLITCSFLAKQCGILGTKYKDELGERIMIYDAQTDIILSDMHLKELREAKLIA